MVRSNWFKGPQPPPPNKFDGALYLKGLRLGVFSQVSPQVIGGVVQGRSLTSEECCQSHQMNCGEYS